MKKSLRIVLAMAALLVGISQRTLAQNAYYWAGGTANGDGKWSTLGNWRLGSPAGPTPPSAPTTNDDVFFEANSFSANGQTVTVDVNASARNMDWTGIDQTVNFTIDRTLTIAGSLKLNTNISTRLRNEDVRQVNAGPNGAIIFTAPADATITSAGVSLDVPVIFDGGNGARWTLQDDITVKRSVTFTKGIVVAKPVAPNNDNRPGFNDTPASILSPMFIFDSSPVVNGGSDESHVDGYIRLTNAGNATSGRLPVGDGSYMRSVELVNVSNANNAFTIRYFRNMAPLFVSPAMPADIEPGSDLRSVSDKEYWYVSRESGSANYRFRIDYNNRVLPTYYRPDVPLGLTIAGLNTANRWENRGGTVNAVNGTIEVESQTREYKWFTIARTDNVRLPVRLVSFSAQQLGGQVKLKWQSAEEKNTSHFEVERSADGKTFSPVLTKKAQGNSASLVSYNAVDGSPLGGTSYYRLKMVDLDGTFEHSKMVSVSTEAGVLVRAYPNPSNGREMRFLAPNGDKLVLQSVTDAFGKAVGYETTAVYAEGLYVSFYGSLPAGFYVATLVTDDDKRERVRVKFVVQ